VAKASHPPEKSIEMELHESLRGKARAIYSPLSRQVHEEYDSNRNKPASSRLNNEFERRRDFPAPLDPQNNLHRNSNT
jgi:hypothetical protein